MVANSGQRMAGGGGSGRRCGQCGERRLEAANVGQRATTNGGRGQRTVGYGRWGEATEDGDAASAEDSSWRRPASGNGGRQAMSGGGRGAAAGGEQQEEVAGRQRVAAHSERWQGTANDRRRQPASGRQWAVGGRPASNEGVQ
ncbi:uncharacterized protein LOC130138513 [Syzygium oleosum]|uniref:uncharacterized protein LOC130138513 n=1 Tax=Syzygium oleosum TaxID=219896 RepID=UPI0024BB623D|nr:uncharacterized protein LOC130138513 [Syzygium oleosum]